MVLYVMMCSVAPVCYNTTYCGGESVSGDLLSYEQCCFESSGVSFASPGQCVLCPKSGTCAPTLTIDYHYADKLCTYVNTYVYINSESFTTTKS